MAIPKTIRGDGSRSRKRVESLHSELTLTPPTTMIRMKALLLALPVFLLSPLGNSEPLPPISHWIPSNSVVMLEITRPELLLNPVFDSELAQFVVSLPAYLAQQDNPEFQEFQGVVKHFETQLQTDWRTALRKLLGGGVAWAAGPSQETLLCLEAKDQAMLEDLHQMFLGIARSEADKQGHADRVKSTEQNGITRWTFGPNEAHAVLGERVLLVNQPPLLQTALDLRAASGRSSLNTLPEYQQARLTVGPTAAGWVFLNLKVLRENPGLQKALAGDGNPLTALLLAGIRESLSSANWLAVSLYVEEDTLRLQFVSDLDQALPGGATEFASPDPAEEGVLPNLQVARRIAGISLYRDLHGFYAAKDNLFPERTSGLIFFENMMGIFFSGLDLTEEVLAETAPEIRLVVARQQYLEDAGTPIVQLPAFAAVFRLLHPETFGPVAEEAWQKAIGLVNFTRGQKALPGLIIDRSTCLDTPYTLSYFRAPESADAIPIHFRYNFRPSLAREGDFLILSSTDQLAEDLIRAVRGETKAAPHPESAMHSLVDINGVALRSILNVNRENMILKNMVDKGHSREQAETEMTLLLTILDSLKTARLSFGQENDRAKAGLSLSLKLPKTADNLVKIAPTRRTAVDTSTR